MHDCWSAHKCKFSANSRADASLLSFSKRSLLAGFVFMLKLGLIAGSWGRRASFHHGGACC